MTPKMNKSEVGAQFSECPSSGTLRCALKVSGTGPVVPVLGENEVRAAPVKADTWELTPSPGMEVFITPSGQRGISR